MKDSDFNITFFEACEILKKSKKSISRYVRRGLLHPERIKSQRGTLEYRFSRADLKAFKTPAETQDKTRPDKTRQDSEVITLLKETTQVLRGQLNVKDKQIKSLMGKVDQLIERGRETNILLGGLQNKVLMLESKDENRGDRQDKIRQDRKQKIKGFFNRLFKRKMIK